MARRAGDAYRQMMLNATPASLFLSSVRLHFLDDPQAYTYFQDTQLRYARKELDTMTFVHRNAVLLQRDVDLLKQLFAFLQPYSFTVTPAAAAFTVAIAHPQMPAPAVLSVRLSPEPVSTAYARAFPGS